MKIRLFAKTLLAVLFCTSTLAAVDADRAWNNEHRMAFSVDPISWTAGNIRFQFEVSMNDRMSFNIPVLIGFDKAIFNNSFPGTQFAPKFGVKYYVTGKATHQGFYVNPLLGLYFDKLNTPAAGTKNDMNAGISYGFRLGFAWNMWRGLWLDSYLGFDAHATSFNSTENSNGTGTGFGRAAGYGFNSAILLGYQW